MQWLIFIEKEQSNQVRWPAIQLSFDIHYCIEIKEHNRAFNECRLIFITNTEYYFECVVEMILQHNIAQYRMIFHLYSTM